MLEFIVLGEVPGTNIQLTFQEVVGLSAIFVLVLLVLHGINARRKLLHLLVTSQGIKKLFKNQLA